MVIRDQVVLRMEECVQAFEQSGDLDAASALRVRAHELLGGGLPGKEEFRYVADVLEVLFLFSSCGVFRSARGIIFVRPF